MQITITVGVNHRQEGDAIKVLKVLTRRFPKRLHPSVGLAREDEAEITFSLPSRFALDSEESALEKGMLLGIIIGVLEGGGSEEHSHTVS